MAVIKDISNNHVFASSLQPLLRTADATGAAVDTQDSVGVAIVANVGASGDTLSGSVYIDLEVQHSDASGSGFVACADADIDAAVTGTNTGTFARIDAPGEASTVYKCNYLGNKRYIKVVANVTGTHTNGTTLGAMVVLKPQHAPA